MSDVIVLYVGESGLLAVLKLDVQCWFGKN